MEKLFPTISERIAEAIMDNNVFAVMSHTTPDGDAVYSCLAMKRILEKLGKKVYLFSDGPFKRRELVQHEHKFSSAVGENVNAENPVLIILDCSTEDRPGNVYQMLKNKKEVIVLDHHSSGEKFYDEELGYIVPESPSTTLLVDQLRRRLGVSLDKEMAEYLLTGFMTDTGFFHFLSPKQAASALHSVADFAEAGASIYELYDRMHDGRRYEDIKVVGHMLENAESYYDGKLIIAYELKEYETEERPGDSVYRNMLEVGSVQAVVLIKEKEGAVEFGFRAKNNAAIDVGKIARSLGGGGHVLASGATVEGLDRASALSLILERFAFLK